MKIVFFSPFSAVLPHKKAEVLLAYGLQKNKHEIFFVNCDGMYKKHCIAMSANGLNEFSDIEDKKNICNLCYSIRDWNNLHFKFKNFNIDAYISEEENKMIEKILKTVNREKCFDFVYDDFEIGKIASYEFLINYKKIDLKLTDDEWMAYLIALTNTLKTYFAFKKILVEIKPDVVMYYDGGYSVNGMVKALAIKNNILAYDFYGGLNVYDRYSKLILVKEDSSKLYENLKKNIWPKLKDKVLGEDEIKNVGNHFGSLFKAKDFAVYSSPRVSSSKNIRDYFGILPNQKLLVATLSSYDERFAENILGRTISEEDTFFSSQATWCLSLVDWVKNRPKFFLVIRVHPREFPNKRENIKSPHAKNLESILYNLPQNVKVNWPEDNISLYNLADETDVFLNAWSTAGVEMSLLGIPVVVYSDKLLYYPSDLNYVATTKEDYFKKIEQAVLDGWSFEKIRLSFRWLTILFSLSTVSMKEKKILFDLLGKFFRLLRKISKLKIFDGLINYFYFRRFFFPNSQINLVEKMLEKEMTSLADLFLYDKKEKTSLEYETKYICVELENLFMKSESRILSRIQKYKSKFNTPNF